MHDTTPSRGTTGGPTPTDDQVRAALRLVVDPEIGINIVDLGLVYRVEVADGDVHVDLTMTSPVCPLSEYVTSNAEATIRQQVPGVRAVDIALVWEPAWHPDLMSEEARRQLGGR